MKRIWKYIGEMTLITFIDDVREAYCRMVEERYDKEFAEVFVTYDEVANCCNTNDVKPCRGKSNQEL